jgi:type I restriction-modification system DNA methylase subunit
MKRSKSDTGVEQSKSMSHRPAFTGKRRQLPGTFYFVLRLPRAQRQHWTHWLSASAALSQTWWQEVTDDRALNKAVRKQLQVTHAATRSLGAKLVKLAKSVSCGTSSRRRPRIGQSCASRSILESTDLQPIPRLPTGIFYAHGVKANGIFFDNRESNPNPWTKEVWYYDTRTNVHHTLKENECASITWWISSSATILPIGASAKRQRTNHPGGRRRRFSYEELKARD